MNTALWALLAAAVIWFGIHLPSILHAHAIAEQRLILEDAEEDRALCEKWGMKNGTHQHTLCTFDLQAMRAKILKRALSNMDPL